MSDIVIKAENLGKKYTIGHKAETGNYTALRDVLMQSASNLWQKTKDLLQGKPIIQGDTMEEVWALKDVSFEIRRGEVVGIIGRNGAGKSTLLKVLSRITEPSAGRVTIKGRVASLLEVGTGFHPELTGRENIYLNGAIMGMARQEIKCKFDEIVAFAEAEKFLDTPVKRYSSGMYVRLAFAVASHLESEILIVDEVLAVGDVAFQKKCLGKMGDVAQEGRTALLVSHNMNSIMRLCSTAILLTDGKVEYFGETDVTIHKYLNKSSYKNAIWENSNYYNPCNYLKPIRLYARDGYGNIIQNSVTKNDQIFIVFEFSVLIKKRDLTIGVSVFDENNQHLFRTLHTDTNENINEEIKFGNNIITCEMPKDILNEGTYLIKFDGSIYKQSWDFNPLNDDDISIKIEVNGDFTVSKYWQNKRAGILAPRIQWRVE